MSGLTAAPRPVADDFRLLPYFVVIGVWMFVVVASVLIWFQGRQADLFRALLERQIVAFASAQEELIARENETTLQDLVFINEAGNVNLTRLFVNALWGADVAPLLNKALAIDATRCRSLAETVDDGGHPTPSAARKACFGEIGARIRQLREFALLDAKVFAAMRRSTVFKIKVFDMRGITVYSSEHAQVGEDKVFNAGWRGAAFEGKARTELTHRDKFSAFEGVVENRDLISSYLPIHAPGSQSIVGVFEIYSDITPFLARVRESARLRAESARDQRAALARAAADGQIETDLQANRSLWILIAMLLLLFIALGALARRADALIRRQIRARERAHQQLTQTEKMASLGQMVAGVTHQLNTPIAFSTSNVALAHERVVAWRREAPSDKALEAVAGMLADTQAGLEQMRELVDNLRDFTRLDRARTSEYDLNRGLHNVVYLVRSVAPPEVEIVEEFGVLPLLRCDPSQLNQAFINLLNNAVQAVGARGRVIVRSTGLSDLVRVDVIDNGVGIEPSAVPQLFETYYTTKPAGIGTGLGLPIARSIIEQHGGHIEVRSVPGQGATFSVTLPLTTPGA